MHQRDVMNVQIPNYKTAIVRDIFAFCRFADLSYIDVKCLTPEYLATDDQNNVWIYETRQKTRICAEFRRFPEMGIACLERIFQNGQAGRTARDSRELCAGTIRGNG